MGLIYTRELSVSVSPDRQAWHQPPDQSLTPVTQIFVQTTQN